MMYYEEEGNSDFYRNVRQYGNCVMFPKFVTNAVEGLTCVINSGEPVTVADYGTADGKYFLSLLPIIKNGCSLKFKGDHELHVMLNDVVSNDFKSVWKNVAELSNIGGVFFSTNAQSFYNQCLPCNSVHMGFVQYATHIFNAVPEDMVLKGTIITNCVRDPHTKHIIAQLAEKDWEEFLMARSKELVSGGVLCCVSLGRTPEDEIYWQTGKWQPMDTAWEILYKEGLISQEESDRAFIQSTVRSEDEHKKPFLDSESAVSKAGLELVHFQSQPFSWLQQCKNVYDETVNEKNKAELLEITATKHSQACKSIFYRHLYKGLRKDRPEKEKKLILDRLFEIVKDVFNSDPKWLEFPYDTGHHFMIIRKNDLAQA